VEYLHNGYEYGTSGRIINDLQTLIDGRIKWKKELRK